MQIFALAKASPPCYHIENDFGENMTREQLFLSVKELFGVRPEFLWKKDPESAIFRNPENDKWFGIVMSVPKSKFFGDDKAMADVLNVKCGPVLAAGLVKKPYVFPAYHMAKGSWISILIADAPSDEEISDLLSLSRAITSGIFKKTNE